MVQKYNILVTILFLFLILAEKIFQDIINIRNTAQRFLENYENVSILMMNNSKYVKPFNCNSNNSEIGCSTIYVENLSNGKYHMYNSSSTQL